MDITDKSTRHSKITGDFGERLVLYLLSKQGYECAFVDHTGIDLIASPKSGERIGVSVKTRSRAKGTEHDTVNISNDNFDKAEFACKTFGCIPYFAIVVDADDGFKVYILSMAHLLNIAYKGKTNTTWKMTNASLKQYADDKNIQRYEYQKTF